MSEGTAPSTSVPRVAAGMTYSYSFLQRMLSNGSFEITEVYERLGHSHCLRVDEGEEEDISSLLLVGIQFRIPVIIRVVTK